MKSLYNFYFLAFALCSIYLFRCIDWETNPSPSTDTFTLVYPEGDEALHFGDTVSITFRANRDSVDRAGIQVSSNDGDDYFHVISNTISIDNGLEYLYKVTWVIGREDEFAINKLYEDLEFNDDEDPQWKCRIKIYDPDDASSYVESESFTVTFKMPYYLRYPAGGEQYSFGDTIPIIYTFRTDSMSVIQYFYCTEDEKEWIQITPYRSNLIHTKGDWELTTTTKWLIPSHSKHSDNPPGDSTKIRINDYSLKRPIESGWIKIKKD